MAEILFTQLAGNDGDIGQITLNRPKALNALTVEMCKALHVQLTKWQEDAKIKAVIIHSDHERAFCVGGDIRYLYEHRDNPADNTSFVGHEYCMNHAIYTFNKPYISLLDGITMGGGVGISFNGSHPVISENCIFAMPENAIGFFPDIGCSYFLSRLPDAFGMYLALTGARLTAADILKTGLTPHYVPQHAFATLRERLLETPLGSNPNTKVDEIIRTLTEPFNEIETISADQRQMIAECFSQDSVEKIIAALSQRGEDDLIATLDKLSPTSLKVTHAQLQRAKTLTMAECRRMEYREAQHFFQGHDLYEGIRAMIIDKDRQPAWQPAVLSAVSTAMIDSYFESTDTELELN